MGKRRVGQEREKYFKVVKNGVPVGFYRHHQDKQQALQLMVKEE